MHAARHRCRASRKQLAAGAVYLRARLASGGLARGERRPAACLRGPLPDAHR